MQISIGVQGLDKVQKKIQNISNKAKDTTPLMAELANHLYNTVQDSFDEQKSPDGISWNPIKSSTHKRKNGSQKILYKSGHMQDSLNTTHNKHSATIGLNATKGGYPYPVIHQFGTKDGKIAARPFMPIKEDESLYDNVKEELEKIIEEYMKL
ncbi:phage virion morphogenesis protein [Sulfurimonas sp.]|uniref:phage virion morphogenesis protein n=1 Tax=Sulfurimonas sp. TaxID=2022749 RepID=UPI0025D3FCE4|nr:phage virion morphogenesis protein [Sulfurimonas sp.]